MIGVYKITNTITGDYYIGSSKNVEKRWSSHRWQSTWKQHPNNQLYVDMQKYGKDNFIMEVVEELSDADIKMLHSREQYYIEQLQPVYNKYVANTGIDTSDRQEYDKQYNKQYYIEHADEKKQYYIEHTDEKKQYRSQHCNYKSEILTLNALRLRFMRRGIEHPMAEAKKYLIS